MLINSANLDHLRIGFTTAFQAGLSQAPSQHKRITTTFRSTTAMNDYGWLGDLPGMREWTGPRVIHSLKQYNYRVENKSWEETIGVNRDHIEDDNLGIYAPRFTAMGQAVGSSFDTLSFALLKAGFATACYDGQYFFDTDHPVLDENGAPQSVANTDGGAGTPWFLIDSKKPINPVILQIRKDAQFVTKDDPRDDRVFMNKEFLYGADGRWNVGFSFWQWSWGSKQTLNAANYAIARAALAGMKGDYGRPIGVTPDLLIVPPSLESAARKLLNSENAAGGETNEWKGTAELLVVPWLA
ncbi:Mu-like prophage major head subunit gpT family protein [Mesorhizobium sp. J428]|uniref:Mu-like prophage major head subunit gpT family protein n=1 Tax=Mesorhizobium sp. J428 TaxID=2898440 RepID=UPI002150E665|nr:Mu-like prophage major head subunit gpT family protein [Mesorhizobium sp. J428]MCR5855989.1 Mu-like prophage major head subunit gpT family protein [Mesorhizobium sp. J428]